MHGPECVILVRHGRSTWSGQDRFIGQLDVPLSAEGIGDAEHVAAEVAKLIPDQLVSSDLLRARDTAVAIGRRCGLPLTVDRRLREEDLGAWSGLSKRGSQTQVA